VFVWETKSVENKVSFLFCFVRLSPDTSGRRESPLVDRTSDEGGAGRVDRQLGCPNRTAQYASVPLMFHRASVASWPIALMPQTCILEKWTSGRNLSTYCSFAWFNTCFFSLTKTIICLPQGMVCNPDSCHHGWYAPMWVLESRNPKGVECRNA